MALFFTVFDICNNSFILEIASGDCDVAASTDGRSAADGACCSCCACCASTAAVTVCSLSPCLAAVAVGASFFCDIFFLKYAI